jgi:hypothetical protein
VGVAYKDSPLAAVGIEDSTTDAAHTITLTADFGNRHHGIAGNGVVIDNGVNPGNAININDDFVTVEWMEIKGGGAAGADGIYVDFLTNGPNANKIVLRQNLIHNAGGDGREISDPDPIIDVYNNVIYRNGRSGIRMAPLTPFSSDSRLRILNNSIFANAQGGVWKFDDSPPQPPLLLRNNVAHSNAGGIGDFSVDALDSLDPSSSHNLSGDPTAPGASALPNVTLSQIAFYSTSLGSENLHIHTTSVARNSGADLSAVFSDDIDATVRPGGAIWDRGADETGPQVNYRSIGTATDLTDQGLITVTAGSTIVTKTGGTGWKAANRGRGDRLTVGANHYMIAWVASDDQLTLAWPAVADYISQPTYTIARQFTTLQGWENCISHGTDGGAVEGPASCNGFFDVATVSLVADDRSEVGIAYNDSVPASAADFTGSVRIDGLNVNGNTDALHTITLTADPGNRHFGVSGAGVLIDNNGGPDPAIDVRDDYVTVELMEIRNGGAVPDGIFVRSISPGSGTVGASRLVLRNNLISVPGFGITLSDGNLVADVYNNIIRGGFDPIRLPFSPLATWSQVRILNNTIYDFSSSGINSSVDGGADRITLINNLALDPGQPGFQFFNWAINTASRNNLTTDASAGIGFASPGGGGLTGIGVTDATCNDLDGCVYFQSCPLLPGTDCTAAGGAGVYNLHLRSGANMAVDAGADLSALYVFDIDTALRQTPWDIGADDFAATTAVTLSSFDATGLDSAVEIGWETASELNNLGFHLHRALAPGGPYERITSSVIPGLGSSPMGRRYSYRDVGTVNGVTYFYKLEDIETTGRTELHGPVSATPQAGATEPSGGGGGREVERRVVYGDPSRNELRVVRQGDRGAVVELVTEGFYAVPQGDGTVRLEVPGFEELGAPGAPAIPSRRVWLEAVAGMGVLLGRASAYEVRSYPDLRPAAAGQAELVVSREGTVRAGSAKRGEGVAFRRGGLYPAEAARLVETGFQGEVKKAAVELSPLRWDGASRQVVLARRLVVRVMFAGSDRRERSFGGPRGRREPPGAVSAPGPVVAQLVVKERGIQAVSFEEVLGTRRRQSLGSLRLSRQGEAVAFHVEPETEYFGSGSVLYFVSEGAALNPYGREAVYELEVGRAGTVMATGTAGPGGGAVESYRHLGEWEENRTYQAGLLQAEDQWQWEAVLSRTTWSCPFGVSALTGGPARLTVWLQGGSDFEVDPDHHVRVAVNGIALAEASWDGKSGRTVEVDVPAGVLLEGANQLQVENVGDTAAAYSVIYLDRFSLSYARRLVAQGGGLRGRFEQTGVAEVSGLGKGTVVVDVTDPAPRWLRGMVPVPGGLRVGVEAGRSYLAGHPLRVDVRRPVASGLRSGSNRADYLVIAPAEFLGAAEPLLARRAGEGLAVKAVAVEEVYQEFGHGESRPEAVKEFLAYAYHRWAPPSVRYVMLLGDATLDFKDHLGTGQANRVPPLMVKTSYLWTSSDPGYAAVNGEDALPDVAIGRLSARDAGEAAALVAKLLAFEDSGLGFGGRAVLVSDNADAAGDFEVNSDALGAMLGGREVERVYLRELGGATRGAILDAFDRGASLVSYVGHGSVAVWASENVLNNTDVARLGPQAQQPFLMTMNCLNGYIQMPGVNSLAEELVKAEGKGAIAAYSPSGLSVDGPAHAYQRALVGELVSGRHERLGDAVLAAQAAYADTGAMPELLEIYHLLGDPGLKLR